MDRNQSESNPIKPVETAGKNQKGASGLERGCVQSTSRSALKSSAAPDVFQQATHAKLLRLVPLCGHSRAPRSVRGCAQTKTGRWNSLYSPRFWGILPLLNFSESAQFYGKTYGS
jgi:hypothetical protein